MLGTDALYQYLDKYDLELHSQFQEILGRHPRKPWNRFITPENQHYVSDESIDFVDKLLRFWFYSSRMKLLCRHELTNFNFVYLPFVAIRYDHQERLTAKEAMAHPYFAPVRENEAKSSAASLGDSAR